MVVPVGSIQVEPVRPVADSAVGGLRLPRFVLLRWFGRASESEQKQKADERRKKRPAHACLLALFGTEAETQNIKSTEKMYSQIFSSANHTQHTQNRFLNAANCKG